MPQPVKSAHSNSRRQQTWLSNAMHYSVAVLSVALALGITQLLHSYLAPTPTPLFFAAVMISAWYGGLKPGIVATLLSTLAINYFLIEPVYRLNLPHPGNLVRLSVFVAAALLINSLHEAQRSAQRKAEANYQSLRDSEARFGCLTESNIIGMLVAQLNGTILDANHNFLHLVGYTQEDLQTGQLHWRNMTPPESLEESEKAVQELLTTGACKPFEKEYIRKDGSRVPVLHGAIMSGEATVTGFVLDLSERKRVEAIQHEAMQRERSLRAELQAANAQLESVLASLNDQFFVLDHEWRYLFVSDRVVEVVGRSREEILGQCIWDLFPQTVNGRFYTEVHRAVSEHQMVHFEYFFEPWERWFENRVYPSKTGVSILVTDITDRKHAEETLQRTNQTLQTLVDVCPVAIAFFDPQGIVKLWNRAAEQIFGWSAAEAIGQFMPTVPHRQKEFLASLQAVLNGQALVGFEVQHQRKNGEPVDLEVWANSTYDAEGNPGCLGIAWDITERKRAEEALRQSETRYRAIYDQVIIGISQADLTGKILQVNERFCEIVQRSPAELLTLHMQDITHPDDLPHNLVLFRRMLQEGTNFEIEKRYLRPNGSEVWVRNYVSLIRDANGNPQFGVAVTEDISKQKQAETEREQLLVREKAARQEAETANRIKDEFLAVLSHELRSPLNPILGWAKLLQTQKLDEQKTQQALNTIERNAKLQTQLIEDLLDVSRILRGKLVLNIAPVSLVSTIEAALETVRLAIDAKGIHLQRSFNLDLDQIMGDAARLQQVMWNLLTNAVKFTPAGGTVEIRLEQLNHCAQLQVKDTGKGINPDFLPYVFDYFRQEDGTTTRKFGGLGLGLAIVRHITELHGGTVSVESRGEDLGATFIVQLPLMPIVVSVDEVDESPRIVNLHELRVLAVDDDDDIRELIEFTLRQAGAEVCAVASASEALQQLGTFAPDVLISDIGMPECDGYMLMQQVKTLMSQQFPARSLAAIALTAYASEIDQQRAIAAGFQMHLAKPVEPDKLISAIVMLLQKDQTN